MLAGVEAHASADAFAHFLDEVAPCLHDLLCMVGLSEANDFFRRVNCVPHSSPRPRRGRERLDTSRPVVAGAYRLANEADRGPAASSCVKRAVKAAFSSWNSRCCRCSSFSNIGMSSWYCTDATFPSGPDVTSSG